MKEGFYLAEEQNFKDNFNLYFQKNNLTQEEQEVKINRINKLKIEIESNNKISTTFTTKNKGDLLEEYFNLVLDLNNKLISYSKNVRTLDNEIDFVIDLKKVAKILRSQEIIPKYIPDHFLVECKNYNAVLGVTYINKFHSLLKIKDYNLGIFIAFNGITGEKEKGWFAGFGLIKKINLLSFHTGDFPLICYADKKRLFSLENILKESDYDLFDWIDNLREETKLDVFKDFEF